MMQAVELGSSGPAWVVSVSVSALALVRAALWLRGSKNGHGNGNGKTGEHQVEMGLRLTTLSAQTERIAQLQESSGRTLERVAERLEHLPTKAEMLEGMKETRHSANGAVDKGVAILREEITQASRDTVDELRHEIREHQ